MHQRLARLPLLRRPPLTVNRLRILHLINLLDKCFEAVAHIVVQDCRSFHKHESVLVSEILSKLSRHFPFLRLLFTEVQLVADEHNHNFRLSVFLHLFDPFLDVHEGLLFCDVVDDQGTDGFSIMGCGDGAETLLTSGVPDLHFHFHVVYGQLFGFEVGAHCRCGFVLGAACVSLKHSCFAYTHIA